MTLVGCLMSEASSDTSIYRAGFATHLCKSKNLNIQAGVIVPSPLSFNISGQYQVAIQYVLVTPNVQLPFHAQLTST